MRRKLILVFLAIVCLFFQFGFNTDATATDQSLVSFSSGALLIEKASEYSSGWGNVWIMDENPRTGWCCPKGKISNNVSVIKLAEKSVFDRLEFDTGHVDKKGPGPICTDASLKGNEGLCRAGEVIRNKRGSNRRKES